ALSMDGGRVVGVERGDGSRQPCDVAVVTAGAWTASLLAPHGIALPLHTRPLQMLLTRPAPGSLAPVLGCFERKISFKQLADGAFLIGGGWPGRVVNHEGNRWQILEDSVRGSLDVAGGGYSQGGACARGPKLVGGAGLQTHERPLHC